MLIAAITLFLTLLSVILFLCSKCVEDVDMECILVGVGSGLFFCAVISAIVGVLFLSTEALSKYQETRTYCDSIGGVFNHNENDPACYLDGERKKLPE